MNNNILNKQINYWKLSASRNWKTVEGLLRLKRYDACLFFCHLTIEKILKGLVVIQIHEPAPYGHNLEKLAELAKIKLTKEQIQDLKIITTFNIACRYDDIKFAFYRKCTKTYTDKYFNITQKLYLWLKKKYQKN